MLVFDYDGDNRDDFLYYQFGSGITVNYGDNQQEEWEKRGDTYVRIFRSTGDGYEEATEGENIYTIFGELFRNKTEITAFDFNGDNRDDLLFRSPDLYDIGKERVWLYRSVKIPTEPTKVAYELVREFDVEETEETFGNFRRTNAAMIDEIPSGSPPIPRVRKSVPSSSISPTDFNGDGKSDLLIVHKIDSYVPDSGRGHTEYYYKLEIIALQSTGDESGFIPISLPLDSDDGLTPVPTYFDGAGDAYHTHDGRTEVLSLDVNADGYSDIVTLIEERLRVSLAQVDSEGNVEFVSASNSACVVGPFPEFPPPLEPQPITQAHGRRLHPMDYNGDGYTDLLVGAAWWDSTPIFNGGEEDYEREYVLFRYDVAGEKFVPVRSKSEVFFKVTPFNFNDDGRTDLLVDCGHIRVSNGDGTFKTVKNNLAQWIWGWECDETGGPWGGDFNYSNSTFTPVDFDGNGIQEIYFEGNFHRYPRFYSPVDPVIQNEFTQKYYRSMIRGWMNDVPYLMNKVTTTYGCGVGSCSDKYHHRVDVTYSVSSGVHGNYFMPHVSSLVTEVTELYGTNVEREASITNYQYAGAQYFPNERENSGYEYVYTTHPDGSYEKAKYYVGAEHEFKRGRLLRQILYAYYTPDITTIDPDRVITDYRWVGTEIGTEGEGLFVRLQGNYDGKPAKKTTTLDSGVKTIIESDYWYDERNGFVTKEVSRLMKHNLLDDFQPEPVTTHSTYVNIGEPSGWMWRKTEEYLTGWYGGVTMYGRNHVHRATHWDYEESTGNLAYEWLVQSEGPPGSHQIETHWKYDVFGNAVLMRDPNGNETEYIYEDGLKMFYQSIRRPTTTNVATGEPTQHAISFEEYDYKHGKPLKHIDENGRTTEYTYDHLGRTKTVIRPHYEGQAEEETVYVDDAFPRYSETHTPTKAGEAPHEIRTYTDGVGQVLQTITRGETVGGAVQYVAVDTHYDVMGRKVRDEGPYFCALKDYHPTTTCKSDVWLRQDYDYLARVTAVETSGEIESATDHFGLMTRHTDPDGKIKFVYKDHRGNIVQIVEQYMVDNFTHRQKTNYGYNAANDLLFIRRADHLNQITLQNSFEYDLYGRTIQTSDPDMGTWTYAYDDNGNLIEQTDANGVTLEFTYDELNRKTTETAYVPERGSAAYAPAWGFDHYYEEGDTVSYNDTVYVAAQDHWSSSSNRPPLNSCIWKILVEWTVGDYYCAGKRIGHNGLVYQSMMGHYASEDWEPGVDDTMWQLETVFEARNVMTFTYDERSIDGLELDPTLNLKGRPYSAQGQSDAAPDKIETKVTFDRYDKGGRLLETTKHISGAPDDGYHTATQYDWAGKPTLVTYQDGYQLEYEYHSGTSLVKSVGDPTDPEQIKLAVLEDYQADGKIGTVTTGWKQSTGEFATQTIYDYEPLTLRLKRIYSKNRADQELQNKEYEYSAAGDVTLIDDSKAGKRYIYEYDDLHRLTAEKHDTGNFAGDDYATLVNTFEKTHPHAVKKTERGMLPGVPTSHYEYDNNGNLIRSYNERVGSGGTIRSDWKRIVYNAKNMPVLIDNYERGRESTTEFVYDTDYKRVRKTVANTGGVSSTIYVSEGYEVKISNVGELNEKTDSIKYIFAGNLRVAKVTDSEVFYIHKDHLGSTSVVTDSMGDYPDGEPEYTEYQPFGLPRPGSELSSKSDYAFTDQEIDRSTGFYNYDARLYNPEIGMFITADSIIPDYFDPQKLNRYAYARNNPIKYIDPDGHDSVGAMIRNYGNEAADKGDIFGMFVAAVAEGAWTALGAEAVSKIADKLTGGESDVGAGDYVEATIEVATAGKGKLIGEGLQKLAGAGGKLLGSAAGKGAGKTIAKTSDDVGKVATESVPKINKQKQAGHIAGTPQNTNRTKQSGKSTSQFYGEKSAEKLTQDTAKTGQSVPNRPNVKEKEYGVSVGTGPTGGSQTKVRVHESPKTGEIHGHPAGPEKF